MTKASEELLKKPLYGKCSNNKSLWFFIAEVIPSL